MGSVFYIHVVTKGSFSETTREQDKMPSADHTWSYDRHIEHESRQSDIPSAYVRPDSIDAWRHNRMLGSVLPLLQEHPGSSWMTIGDGNYGSDAFFLQKNGADSLATSISDSTLRIGHEMGFIARFRAENAEHLSATDGEFDFTFCKEAYHHFPRPPIAFYEMLRVARIGTVLIEPTEDAPKLLDRLKIVAKKLLRKDKTTLFETSGNFIYRLNVTEIAKMMTALNYEVVAFRPFNDFYHPSLSGGAYARFGLRTLLTKAGVLIQDFFCRLRLLNYGLSTTIAFKSKISGTMKARLKAAGFRILELPRNPYL